MYCYARLTGDYEMEFMYGGVRVPGGPYYVRTYDMTRIKVSDCQDGVVGQETSFRSTYIHLPYPYSTRTACVYHCV